MLDSHTWPVAALMDSPNPNRVTSRAHSSPALWPIEALLAPEGHHRGSWKAPHGLAHQCLLLPPAALALSSWAEASLRTCHLSLLQKVRPDSTITAAGPDSLSGSRNMETVPETRAQQTLTYNSQPREQRLWQPAERDPGDGHGVQASRRGACRTH